MISLLYMKGHHAELLCILGIYTCMGEYFFSENGMFQVGLQNIRFYSILW